MNGRVLILVGLFFLGLFSAIVRIANGGDVMFDYWCMILTLIGAGWLWQSDAEKHLQMFSKPEMEKCKISRNDSYVLKIDSKISQNEYERIMAYFRDVSKVTGVTFAFIDENLELAPCNIQSNLLTIPEGHEIDKDKLH